MHCERFSEDQIENIVDKLAPVIAAPEDIAVFRFMLREVLQGAPNTSSAANFVKKILDTK